MDQEGIFSVKTQLPEKATCFAKVRSLYLKPEQTEKIVPYYLVARCANCKVGVELIVEETEAVNQLESRSRCTGSRCIESILVPGVETCWIRRSAQRKIVGLYYVRCGPVGQYGTVVTTAKSQ